MLYNTINLSQNLVEVIREQQLAEWVGDSNPLVGTLQDDCKCLIRFAYTRQLFFFYSDPYPVTLKLHTRLCTETYNNNIKFSLQITIIIMRLSAVFRINIAISLMSLPT